MVSSNKTPPRFFGHKRLRKLLSSEEIVKFVPDIMEHFRIVPLYEFQVEGVIDASVQVFANDTESKNVEFKLLNYLDLLKIDPSTGQISQKKSFYKSQRLEIFVRADDTGNPVRSAYAIVILSVIIAQPTTPSVSTIAPSTTTVSVSTTSKVRMSRSKRKKKSIS